MLGTRRYILALFELAVVDWRKLVSLFPSCPINYKYLTSFFLKVNNFFLKLPIADNGVRINLYWIISIDVNRHHNFIRPTRNRIAINHRHIISIIIAPYGIPSVSTAFTVESVIDSVKVYTNALCQWIGFNCIVGLDYDVDIHIIVDRETSAAVVLWEGEPLESGDFHLGIGNQTHRQIISVHCGYILHHIIKNLKHFL